MFGSRTLLSFVALAAVVVASAAQAQSTERIGLLLTVSHATQQPGPVDPGSAEIYKRLHEEFRFQSLRVIERRQNDLRLQEVGGVVLPTGKRVSLRPMSLSTTGVLIASRSRARWRPTSASRTTSTSSSASSATRTAS